MYIFKNLIEIIKEISVKKKILLSIISLMVIAVIIFAIIPKNKKKSITGEEWFEFEMSYMDDMRYITDQLDTVVSLYCNGNLSSEAYYEQMKVIKQEMILFLADYNDVKSKVDIKLGTHTLGSKIGSESAEKSYYIVSDLIDYCMSEEYYLDKDKLLYMYMAQKERLSKELYTYAASLTAKYKDYFIEMWASSTDATETDAE